MQTRNVLAGSTILGSLIALVAGFEGYRTDAYRDTGGVWTICYGETKGVKRGDTATKQQCDNMLIKSLLAHNKPFESLPYVIAFRAILIIRNPSFFSQFPIYAR